MSNSTHKAECVKFKMERHPNADSLSLAAIDGYTVCLRTEDWLKIPPINSEGERLAIFVPPDNLVKVSRDEFKFLEKDAKADGRARIKAKKLRGIVSFGLLIPAPEGAQVGEDWAERLEITHYEPDEANLEKGGPITAAECASAPPIYSPKYDVDAFRKYAKEVFEEGEPLFVSCKVDGCNYSAVYLDGQFHVKSRTMWKKEFPTYDHVTLESLLEKGVQEEKAKEIVERLKDKPQSRNMWWDVLYRYENIQKFLKDNPGYIIWGEIYGQVGGMPYDVKDRSQPKFLAFDIMVKGKWLNIEDALSLADKYELPWVPYFNERKDGKLVGIPYNFDKLCEMAEGPTLIPNSVKGQIREGVCVKPLVERFHPKIGRVHLKIVSGTYLEKKR